jgi:mono/diheme cytochrome c family protein
MKYIPFILALNIFAFANTTMCYKNNLNDISDIENKKFDGGECKGINTISDMKANNWNIDDIKISQKDDTFSFIYILKKDIKQTNIPTTSTGKIDYDKLSKVVKQNKKQEKLDKSLAHGKRVYNKNCKSCHGTNGKQTPQNTSLAISNFDLETLQSTMRAYSWDEQDKGFAMVMKPYSDLTTPKEIENIYKYLQSINKK